MGEGDVGDRGRRAAAVATLRGLQSAGRLTAAHVRQVANEFGVHQRTVERWLARLPASDLRAKPHSDRFEVTREDISELAYWHGNIQAFIRARSARGSTLPSRQTVERAFHRALTPGQLAGLVGGEGARREFDTYLSRPPQHRNDCWEADHNELAVEVILPGGRVGKPWLTSFLDAASRAVCGWAISDVPTQASVFAGLRAAILVDPPFGPIGGVPLALRWDRGKEFLANAVVAAAQALAIDARPLPPYSPYLKGVVERWHETIETMLLAELPGFTHGPSDRAGRRVDRDAPLLSLEALVELFAAFTVRYNTEYPHSALEGETPRSVWERGTAPLVHLPREHLNHLLLARKTRMITSKGVSLFGHRYNAAEFVGRVGQKVEVRYMPYSEDSVEAFLDGEHLCTAWLVDAIERAEMQRLLAKRVRDARWLVREQKAAARLRRERFAPLTSPRSAQQLIEGRHATERARLTPSRSLVDHSVIPSHMVRPLPAPIPDDGDPG